jgi:hypothetical protein
MASDGPKNLMNAIRTLNIRCVLPTIFLGNSTDKENGRDFDLFGAILPKDAAFAREKHLPYSVVGKSYYRIYRDTGTIVLAESTWPSDIKSSDIICIPRNTYNGKFKVHLIYPGDLNLDLLLNYVAYLTKPDVFALTNAFPFSLWKAFQEQCEKIH